MDIIQAILQSAYLIFIVMTLFYLLSLSRRQNDVADVVWGFGLIFIAISTLISMPDPHFRALMVTILVVIWGLRLSFFIYRRNKLRGEDFRFQRLREKWGRYSWIRSYFQLFLLQGVLLLLVSLPVIVINTTSSMPAFGILDLIGLIVWLFGFIFEVVGDHQKARFRKDPSQTQSAIFTGGLWRYSRHPNYFGEILQWVGIFIIALGVPYWLLSLIGPLTVIIMLLKISGIHVVEKKYKDNPEFQKYKQVTSALIPRRPHPDQ